MKPLADPKPAKPVGTDAPNPTDASSRGILGKVRPVFIWTRTYWKIVGAAIVAIVATYWVWDQVGFKAVWPSILVGLTAALLFWFAVKITYLKLIRLNYDRDREALFFGEWWIPRHRATEVKISGPRGWCYGPDNEMVYIVKDFNPKTMVGHAHFPDNWTAARVIGHLEYAQELIAQNQAMIAEYAGGAAKAEADKLKFWALSALMFDIQLYDSDTLQSQIGLTREEAQAVIDKALAEYGVVKEGTRADIRAK